VSGYVAREFSPIASHWKSVERIDDYMKKHGVVGLDGIDTRALVRHLRDPWRVPRRYFNRKRETSRRWWTGPKRPGPWWAPIW
jgi:carbamoyl-phosphate synthase small subunit